jgi:hypothetical protein
MPSRKGRTVSKEQGWFDICLGREKRLRQAEVHSRPTLEAHCEVVREGASSVSPRTQPKDHRGSSRSGYQAGEEVDGTMKPPKSPPKTGGFLI